MTFDFAFDPYTVKPDQHYEWSRREGVVRPISDSERFLLLCHACGTKRVIRSSKAMRMFHAKGRHNCTCGNAYHRGGAFSVAGTLGKNLLVGMLLAKDPVQWWQQQGLGRVLQSDGNGTFSVPRFMEWLEHHAPTVLRLDWVSVLRAYLVDIEQPPSRLNLVQAVMVDGRQVKPAVNQDPLAAETFARTAWFPKYMGPLQPRELTSSARRKDLQAKKLPEPVAPSTIHAIWLDGEDFYPRPRQKVPESEPAVVNRCLQDIRRAVETALAAHLQCTHAEVATILDRGIEVNQNSGRLFTVGYRGALSVHRLAGLLPELYERALGLTDMTARAMVNAAAQALRSEKGTTEPLDPFPGCELGSDPGTCIGTQLLDLRMVRPARAVAYACGCRELHLVHEKPYGAFARRPDAEALCKDCGKPLQPATSEQVLAIFPAARRAVRMKRAA